MKKDKHKTKVIFLIEKPEGDLTQQVFAFFPELHTYHKQHPNYGVMFDCYAHIGQHSACHIDYANECKVAKPTQYKNLFKELEGIGYNLSVTRAKKYLTSILK
ncbi:MAG TPA: hypothetical protein ACFYEK_01170 [Candidatus Wunengus sp. YC60]|uniref:hypothetical protein n=1 Tax=Candidatus Wunengus sp. YC60 TaxID=3367697 RepID=UPI004025FCE7